LSFYIYKGRLGRKKTPILGKEEEKRRGNFGTSLFTVNDEWEH